MKKLVYHIYNEVTKTIILDNVPFDDVPELVITCTEYYKQSCIACFTEETIQHNKVSNKQDFETSWLDMVDELIDNFYDY